VDEQVIRRVAWSALVALWVAAPRAARSDADAGFRITFKQEVTSYRDAATFVLPQTPLTISADGPDGRYALAAANGVVDVLGPRTWTWHAPATPGVYDIEIAGPAETDTIALHAFVMVPASQVKDGLLRGYAIGRYPAKPLNGNPLYLPPDGFVEVTKSNADTKLSPHFTLKQFICKQDPPGSFPKYLVLHERLPQTLELVLDRVNALGFDVDTLHVMSGYRTPYYNQAIGDVQYSMHQWGSAADVYVDPSDNGRMDDLNHDRRIDIGDAKFLYDEVDRLLDARPYRRFQGGLGFYPKTAAHPPFVHVDVRGSKARWKG
jgi:hypothetical protein